MKKNLLLIAISISTIILSATVFSENASNVSLNTDFKDHYGPVNARLSIQCNSSVVVQNTDSKSHRYLIGTQVCAQNNECRDNADWVIIDSGKTFKNAYSTVELATFNRKGTKDLTCNNFVAGDVKKSDMKHAFAFIG